MAEIKIRKSFIVLCCITVFFLVFMGGYILYLLFYTLLTIFILSYIYIRTIKDQIKVEINLPGKIFYAGDSANWKVQVAADWPVPYVVVTQDESNITSKIAGKITLSENLWIDHQKTFHQRGEYNIGRIVLQITDLLNIISLTLTKDLHRTIRVHPGLYSVNLLQTSGKDIFLEMLNSKSQKENPFYISNIKKYYPGDPEKKIHWKVSAKYSELHVKHFDNTSGEGLILIIDLTEKNYSYDNDYIIEENIVDTLCSIIQLTVKNKVTAHVFINSSQDIYFEITSISDFHDFIDFIINFKSSGNNDFSQFVNRIVQNQDHMSKIIIVSADIDKTISEQVSTRFSNYQIDYIFCLHVDNFGNNHTGLNYANFINKEERLFL